MVPLLALSKGGTALYCARPKGHLVVEMVSLKISFSADDIFLVCPSEQTIKRANIDFFSLYYIILYFRVLH